MSKLEQSQNGLSQHASSLLAGFDRSKPTPVRRSTERVAVQDGHRRSLALEGEVEVEGGGVFLPIAGFGRAKPASKGVLIIGVGVALTVVANGALLLFGVASLARNALASGMIMSAFAGWGYRVRAVEEGMKEAGERCPGILALPDELILHYPDGDLALRWDEVRDFSYFKNSNTSRDGEHMIVVHELVAYVGRERRSQQIWRLTQYSGAFDRELDAAVGLMPAVGARLERIRRERAARAPSA